MELIYAFICRHWKQFGYGPTLREISLACFTSRPNIYRYLDKLQAKGLITHESGKARSIALVEPCPNEPDQP